MKLSELPNGTYWITRDSMPGGTLEGTCDVWGSKPYRAAYQQAVGHCWLSDGSGIYTLITRATVEEVKRQWNVVPETDIECIRVEV